MTAAALGDGRTATQDLVRAGAASTVGFDKVSVAYRGAVVLKPLTLEVAAGEILAMIGPSGSGKTTALRAVAGFVRPVSGRIRVGGTDVTDLPPYERGLAMVVQNYALFPHMRVADNVAFGLRARGAARTLIESRVDDALGVVGMRTFRKRYPRELSGGQQQRVAIARALAVRPRVLLLDEPLSALDAQIRRSMVEEIARLHADLPDLTILYVTHDQSEALTLADRIAILKDGALCAVGRTADLYRRPPNRFAAEFLGRANLLPVVIEDDRSVGGMVAVRAGADRLLVAGDGAPAGTRRLLCVRPQHLTLTAELGYSNRIGGRLRQVHWQGELTHLVAEVGDSLVRIVATRLPALPERGGAVDMFFAPGDASLIPEEAGV
ncbi:2-aminoethylphosphonate transport system ATP-binding protein [Roseiarcus fermentans]|uniref:2-aminoethylphosphonate transport system ATP-binding protein n=1 Tax=Roseiarcus fermentans TaxID=1473586 RepID=A0A366ER81_9HYPH|nr:ATP-binding cassette domain-containing protein [Roseiarcus fermentans]RBP04190.1 2-aminoethylphosphonate transport system ATP-binding protein [Roseiarcus fermentans]